MVEIDGSIGEGGGQVLRSALTLSLLTQKPFQIRNIRKGRSKPGLRAQHLASVRASKMVGRAVVKGDTFGSQELQFAPSGLFAGEHVLDIGTAGACSLVIQTILLPLSCSKHASRVVVKGGTHVPWSPTFDYLNIVWIPAMKHLGYPASIEMIKAGFYPRGGGRIELFVEPCRGQRGLTAGVLQPFQHLLGLSVSANLKGAVASRQREQMLARLNENHLSAAIEVDELDSAGKGSAVFISSASMPSYFGFSGLGVKGKPAERVADEAINQLLTFLESGAALDRYLADQVLIPLSVASENSQFRIETVSKHFVTNVEIIRKFLDVSIEFVRSNNGSARVDIEPASTLSWA